MTLVRDAIVITRREMQVVDELLRDGADIATIARRLNISPETVKTHLRHVYAKTGCADRTELAVSVLRNHIHVITLAPGQQIYREQ